MERSLTTGSKGAGFAAALCFEAVSKSPVPSFGMKTLGEEGTVPGGVFAQHLTLHDPPRSPKRHSKGGWHAHPAGSEGPPRGVQHRGLGTTVDKVPQLWGKESACLCLYLLVASPGHRLERTLFGHFV